MRKRGAACSLWSVGLILSCKIEVSALITSKGEVLVSSTGEWDTSVGGGLGFKLLKCISLAVYIPIFRNFLSQNSDLDN